MSRKIALASVGLVGLGTAAEGATAAGMAGSPFLSSTVCMSAPVLLGLVLTPTSAIGNTLSAIAKRQNGGT